MKSPSQTQLSGSSGAPAAGGLPPYPLAPTRPDTSDKRKPAALSNSIGKADYSRTTTSLTGRGGGKAANSGRGVTLASTLPVGGGVKSPLKKTVTMTFTAASGHGLFAGGKGSKLIPGSNHSKGGSVRARKPLQQLQRQPFQRTATGGEAARMESVAASTDGGTAGPSSSKKTSPARRIISGALPRMGPDGTPRGGISVVGPGLIANYGDGGEEDMMKAVPAYLTALSIPSTHSPEAPNAARPPSGRPKSALYATLSLTDRPRNGVSEEGSPADHHAAGVDILAMSRTYFVGNAIVNPFVAVSPAVQQGVREVTMDSKDGSGTVALPSHPRPASAQPSTMSNGRAAALRSDVGPTLISSAVRGAAAVGALGGGAGAAAAGTERGAGEDNLMEADGQRAESDHSGDSPVSASSEVPNMPNFLPPTPTRPVAGPFPSDGELLLGVIPTEEDGLKRENLFFLEGISHRKVAPSTAAQAGVSSAMLQLRALYGTTSDDLPAPAPAAAGLERGSVGGSGGFVSRAGVNGGSLSASRMQASATITPAAFLSVEGPTSKVDGGVPSFERGTVAWEVLPELMVAEARSAELAAVRRRIDWDVAIPSAGCPSAAPMPAIAFLDAAGHPVVQLSKVHLVFNTTTLSMERDVEEDMKLFMPQCSHANGSGNGNAKGGAHPPSMAANKVAAAVRTVGQSFTQGSASSSLFRFHGLVGLMPGLAEKVGLSRVMEYQVACQSDSVMLLSAPYIDADVGDLVVHVNPSLLGLIRLTITGFDCAAVDPLSGAIAESSNVLTVVIRCLHTPLPDSNRLAAAANEANEAGGARLRLSPPPATSARTPSEQPGPGGRVSPACLNLTLASFRKDQDGRMGSRSGNASAAAGRIGSPSAASRCPTPPIPSPVATARAAATAAAGPAAGGYVFPATNPHELRYADSKYSSREYVFAQIYKARLASKREKAARERKLQAEEKSKPGETAPAPAPAPASSVAPPADDDTAHTTEGGLTDGDSKKPPVDAVVQAEEREATAPDGDDAPAAEGAVRVAGDNGGAKEETAVSTKEEEEVETKEKEKEEEKEKTKAAASKRGHNAGGHTKKDGKGAKDSKEEEEEELFNEKEKLWRSPRILTSRFLLGSLQCPLGHLRLTYWQDRLTSLFQNGDQDLFDVDNRSQVKKQAKAELPDSIIAGLSGGAYAASHGSAAVGASTSSRAGKGAPQYMVPAPPRGSGAALPSSTSLQAIGLLRRLVLCLLLEENRGSQQLFLDTVELCSHLSRNALLRTIAVTGGTSEGLQSLAAAVLAPTPPAADKGKGREGGGGGSSQQQQQRRRFANLSEKEHMNLSLLASVLEVCLSAMVSIGCYAEAVNYATQRVHTLCMLEGDTTDVVCASQKDLAEVLFLYGDFAASLQVAQDALMLTGQLYFAHSTEEVEVKILVALAAAYCGKLPRTRELVVELMQLLNGDAGANGNEKDTKGEVAPAKAAVYGSTLSPLMQAEIKLVYALVCPALEYAPPAPSPLGHEAEEKDKAHEDGVSFNAQGASKALDDAIRLLSDVADLAELDKSASQAALFSGAKGKGGEGGDAQGAGLQAAVMAWQRRTRWNLLSFAGVLLLQNGETDRGIGLLEKVLSELTLKQHRLVERSHCASISAVLWVILGLWKVWSNPTAARDILPMLKRTVQQLTRNRGPYHPLAAVGNTLLASTQKAVQHNRALSVVLRIFGALQKCVSPRSNYMLLAHVVCSDLYSFSRRWRPSLEHANAALIICQMNGNIPDICAAQETTLLGALLRCPPTAVVTLQPRLLIKQLEDRITTMEAMYGTYNERVAVPLVNAADAHFLLKDYGNALSCLQRALRLVDPKGILIVSHAILKPECQLSAANGDVERRRLALNALLQSPSRLLTVADILFSIGATLEAQAVAEGFSNPESLAQAQDAYLRSLAVLETASLAGSLASVRVYEALAKSFYSLGAYADALSWALQAQRAIHASYKEWSHEVTSVKTLVASVQERLYEQEGTYVCINTLQSIGVESSNTKDHQSTVELL